MSGQIRIIPPLDERPFLERVRWSNYMIHLGFREQAGSPDVTTIVFENAGGSNGTKFRTHTKKQTGAGGTKGRETLRPAALVLSSLPCEFSLEPDGA